MTRWLSFVVFCLLEIGWFVVEWFQGFEQWLVRRRQSKQSFVREARCHGENGIRRRSHGVTCKGKQGRGISLFSFWMIFMVLWRVGEAHNPGPQEADCWSLGTFNPSGVTSKADVIGQLEGDFWGICETHLSVIGKRRFVHALRCQKSKWSNFITGAPCPLRARSEEVGSFKGVAGMTSWPARALAHSLHDGWYQSARVQVLGAFIHNLWISIAVVYGYPYSRTHHAPRFQTEQLLAGAIDRIACQTSGPRVVMGDFNWEQDELAQLKRLEDLGFKDLQTLAFEWWGTPIKATGRGSRRIDYVYVSPELWPLLQKVVVDDAQWADHSAVYGVFRGWKPAIEKHHGKFPVQAEWPEDFPEVAYPNLPNQTVAYASFWKNIEQAASDAIVDAGGSPWVVAQCGRGQTLDTATTMQQQAPIRKSRWGEESPCFFGNSIRYSQQFKQVRRCQSLVALCRSNPHVTADMQQLWRVILAAPGFPGGFSVWWTREGYPKYGGPAELQDALPNHDECQTLFLGVKTEVQGFANQLSKQRYRRAKEIRANNMRYVYKDCAREPPKKVDVLVESVTAEVHEVDQANHVVQLSEPSKFSSQKTAVVQGVEVQIHPQDATTVVLDPFPNIQPGDEIRQTTVVAALPEVFEAFRQEWEPRWNRHSSIRETQWDQICGFAKDTLRPIQWNFTNWSEDMFTQVVRSKKATAATGPDGVTRQDLLALPRHAITSLLGVYHKVEHEAKWPLQLTTGIVSSLEKTPDAQSVRQYRPVVVYPMVYRVWSSARARQFLKMFAKVTPPGLRGGLPAQQSKSIWFEMALAIEEDQVHSQSLLGLVADLQKAFNTIPRCPIWQCLISLGCPSWLIRGWAAFVNQQVRRFKVRNSIGPAIPSDCGYPEGCGLSVCAMAVIDLLLDHWMRNQFPFLKVLTYVDDWQLLHSHQVDQAGIENSLLDFVASLDMCLDHGKTFTWSTNAACRSQLRGGRFKVVHHARSLGVHANFTRQTVPLCCKGCFVKSFSMAKGITWNWGHECRR